MGVEKSKSSEKKQKSHKMRSRTPPSRRDRVTPKSQKGTPKTGQAAGPGVEHGGSSGGVPAR